MRKPDFENLLKVLAGEKPKRDTLFEFFLNEKLYRKLCGHDPDSAAAYSMVTAFKNAGYDYVTHHAPFGFKRPERSREKSISLNDGLAIQDRKSFESYEWPDPDKADYSTFEKAAKELPDGMKLVACGPGGVMENVISLTGYDNLCFMLADDESLTKDICDAVGSRLLRHYEICASIPSVGAMISNDDWGFKTQPMMSPDDMRKYIFPWHRRIVEAGHKAGKPVILHSCGNLESVMDEIIDDLKYDGKHSYEDTILPVEDAYEKYCGRIAILGGIDLDFICRSSPAAVKERSRKMLERASSRGGYALGSGNSIPDYVPSENYFAMTSALRD